MDDVKLAILNNFQKKSSFRCVTVEMAIFFYNPKLVISSGVQRSREICLEVDLSTPLRFGRDDD
jgi:hypothetical protein